MTNHPEIPDSSMNDEMRLNLRRCATQRAHLAGADALIFEREAATLLKRATAARQLYYRELITIDLLGGHGPSAFEGLIR
jgi:hypothetical protein